MIEAIRRAWARRVARLEEQRRLEEMAAAHRKAFIRAMQAATKQICEQNKR